MLRTNYKDEINGFYNFFISKCNGEITPEIVGWDSISAQRERFAALFQIGITEDDTVLDLGCGVGNFISFLKYCGLSGEKYFGLDINSRYIEIASKLYPENVFKEGEIFDLSDSFDYVIGSGVFTVKMPENEIFDVIEQAYKISKKGIAFNFLSENFGGDEYINVFDPDKMFNKLHEKYENMLLRTDYYKNEDFTIYIYKT
jgi:SAM-dependent methyltransferase